MIGLPLARPCPFCGSSEVNECIKKTENSKNGKPVTILFMKCYVCDASSKAFAYEEYDESSYWTAWGNSLDAWNRRT